MFCLWASCFIAFTFIVLELESVTRSRSHSINQQLRTIHSLTMSASSLNVSLTYTPHAITHSSISPNHSLTHSFTQQFKLIQTNNDQATLYIAVNVRSLYQLQLHWHFNILLVDVKTKIFSNVVDVLVKPFKTTCKHIHRHIVCRPLINPPLPTSSQLTHILRTMIGGREY